MKGLGHALPKWGRTPARIVSSAFFLSLVVGSAGRAEARTTDECLQAWSKAVRSYLTQNRKAAPDGTVPKDMEGTELAAQKWLSAFRPACEFEAAGDKPSARIEAAALGVKILARLDLRGCSRFLEYYMQSTRPREICRVARSADDDQLRRQIETTIPSR